MWFHRSLCFLLLAHRWTSADPSDIQLVVGLFNELSGLSVSFDHDFGAGVSLLNGEAKVYMYNSVELLPYSEHSQEQDFHIYRLLFRSPLGFRIIPKRDLDTLNLDDCYVKVEYSVSRVEMEPLSVRVDSCTVTYLNGTAAGHGAEEVLPSVSRALFLAASKFLSFQSAPQELALSEVWEVFASLIYHVIVG